MFCWHSNVRCKVPQRSNDLITVLAQTDAITAKITAVITAKDQTSAQKEVLVSEKDAICVERDRGLAQKDAALSQLQVELEAPSTVASTDELDDRRNQILAMESIMDSRVQHLAEQRASLKVQQ